MSPLLRPLFERWLLDATQAPLAPWKRSLLLRALKQDTALRQVALELADFEHRDAPEPNALPDLAPRLKAILSSDDRSLDQPLLPSAWLPAGALAAMLLVIMLVTLFDGRVSGPQGDQQARVQDNAAALALAIPTFTPTPTPVVKP